MQNHVGEHGRGHHLSEEGAPLGKDGVDVVDGDTLQRGETDGGFPGPRVHHDARDAARTERCDGLHGHEHERERRDEALLEPRAARVVLDELAADQHGQRDCGVVVRAACDAPRVDL